LFAELHISRITLPRGVSYSSKEQVSGISLFNTSAGKYRFTVADK
jgi:hypothetical protein